MDIEDLSLGGKKLETIKGQASTWGKEKYWRDEWNQLRMWLKPLF